MQNERPQAATEKDRFGDLSEKTLAFVRKNRAQVALGVAGAVLLMAMVSGLGLYKQKAVRLASLALQASQAEFQALEAQEGREVARKRWLGEAPAALKRLKGGAASYGAALLWYGGLAFENADFESAATWYEAAAGCFGADGSLRNIAWCGQGQALEQLGKPEAAAPLYEKIRNSGLSVKHEEATFLLARIKEGRGDTQGAVALYREIVGSTSASLYKQLAAEKVPGV